MPRLRLLPETTKVYDTNAAAKVLQYLMKRGGPIAIDTETTGLDVMRDRVLFWSMATENERYFIPVKLLLFFDPLFLRKDITWYLANAKYDLHLLNNMGVHLHGPVHDIIVMDAMDDDTRAHGLKEQARIAYDVSWGDFKDLFIDPKYVADQLGLDKPSFVRFKKYSIGEKLLFVHENNATIVEDYASCDAFFTYQRAEDLATQLTATPLPTEMVEGFDTLYDYFTLIEVPFTKVLWKMERCGVPVDFDQVKKIDGPMRDGINGLEKQIKSLVSPTFNPGSTDELVELLFGKRGFNLAPVSYTKTGQASTSEKDLSILQNRVQDRKIYEVLKAVLDWRHLKKLHGTYVANIKDHLGPDDRIHCKLNQTGTRTGRLSASNPNLQNIPIRNDEFHIRSMFVCPDGDSMLGCDYPQIQPRLAAVFAGEEKMLDAIRAGFDLHSANAANMYGPKDPRVTYEAIDKAKNCKELREKLGRPLTDLEKYLLKKRDGAKTVGLGVLFGEGKTKMAHQLGIEVHEAAELIDTFFTTYPNLKKLIDDTHKECHELEYAYTMLGRIRRLHMINNPHNYGKVAGEERAGFNHKIQGSEMEVMKLAMLQLDASPEWNALGGRIALTVHDELLSFAPADCAEDALEVKSAIMADPLNWGPIKIQLPLSVKPDGGIGRSWTDVH